MPRVTQHTKRNAGKYTYRCRGCGQEIVPGDRYYEWEKRYGGPQRRHVACGYPRPSELSGRKTAVVEDAIQDASKELAGFQPAMPSPEEIKDSGFTYELDYEAVTAILESVASTARDVASEYEDGVSNMPDALQYSPTAEAMTQVAEELNYWADEIESFEPESTVDFPEYNEEDEDADEDSWVSECEEVWQEAVAQVVSDAEDAMSEMPEYQG